MADLSPDDLLRYASRIDDAIKDLEQTSQDLKDAAEDRISQTNIDLSGCYAASALGREVTIYLEAI